MSARDATAQLALYRAVGDLRRLEITLAGLDHPAITAEVARITDQLARLIPDEEPSDRDPEPDDNEPGQGEGFAVAESSLAGRDGAIEAGSGFGRYPGGMIDYRANGSSVEAKRLGANALLASEALRRSRDLGHRWMNWGGVTIFKRQLGGKRVNINCWLGGGRRWAVPNFVVSTLRGARPVLAAWQPLRALPSIALPARGE